jgi:hypothetical protein
LFATPQAGTVLLREYQGERLTVWEPTGDPDDRRAGIAISFGNAHASSGAMRHWRRHLGRQCGKPSDAQFYSGRLFQFAMFSKFCLAIQNPTPGAIASIACWSCFKSEPFVYREVSQGVACPVTRSDRACAGRPSRAKHAFAPRYKRWHISHGFGEGDPR